ncbi:YggS family pyridoxal phosphate-dependent enzyme [Propionicicella superfundia]|uniref:YggS family pyridoxal phosphate-dependent enzyme n=1 Tax=Propionicicella superfundia TaxID=348582 RepID=UPI00041B077D|nr:YggS family pyridoxal phosphate-dependent enzyme [Propionicicella superfundia]
MNDIASRLTAVRDRIAAACRAADRDPADVRLLPVSKTKPSELVRAAAAAGCDRFGENMVQEARRKARELADVPGLSWAIIGHLQTNKAKYLPEFAAEFQALDSLALATELDRRFAAAGRTLDVLIEVNSSGENSKFGLPPAEVPGFAAALHPFEALRVRGLMTIASRDRAARDFAETAALRDRLRGTDGLPGSYDELSMGMSGDFEEAIAHGATCVRVGTAIFGSRAARPV